MIDYNENKDRTEKKITKIELGQDMVTIILNIYMSLSMVMVMCNKQHLSNI